MWQEQKLDPTSPSDSAAGFPPLKTIWEDHYCQKCNVGNKKGWECLHCGQQFKPVHHARACAHYAKIPKEGVAVCTTAIPEVEFKRYIDLWSRSQKRKTELTMVKMIITKDKEERLSTVTNRLLEESNKKPKIATEMRQYFKSAVMNKSTNPSGQLTIDAVFDNLYQADITHMNHAKMNIAVATFFMRIIFLMVVLNPLLLRSCSIMPGWWGETTSHWEGGTWATLCLISITGT
jgi:hypothetical protein